MPIRSTGEFGSSSYRRFLLNLGVNFCNLGQFWPFVF